MNWMSILGLSLLILGTVFSFLGTYFSDKKSNEELTTMIQEKNETIDSINVNNIKLIDQNSSLLNSNVNVSETNKDLISQNNIMIEKIQKYQSDIEIREEQIKMLEKQVMNVKEYIFYATLDLYGKPFSEGWGINITSDLSGRMEKILVLSGNNINVKNDKSVLIEINEVIERYPNFPFGYWAKYNFLRSTKSNDWQKYAKKTFEILEITTSIKGHNLIHDQVLKKVKLDLTLNQ